MEKGVILILENEMVDVMLEIDREIYGKYVIYRKNKKTHVCSPQQGDVRNAKGSTSVLDLFQPNTGCSLSFSGM